MSDPGFTRITLSPAASAWTSLEARRVVADRSWLFIPLVKLLPGMTQTPQIAARRYLQASEFGTDVSRQFFASPPNTLTGPIEAMRHPHLHDRTNQEAAWQAVVNVSGVGSAQPSNHGALEYGSIQ